MHRRYCLHLSTWCVLLATTLLFVLLIVPCSKPSVRIQIRTYIWAEHGFPFTYLVRMNMRDYPRAWHLTDSVCEFRSAALAIDIFIGVVGIVTTGLVWEWWQRRRGRPRLQYSLKTLFLVLTAGALVCSYWRFRYARHALELDAREALRGRAVCCQDFAAPDWMWRIAENSGGDYDIFDNTMYVCFDSKEVTKSDLEMLERFRYLRVLVLSEKIEDVAGLVALLRNFRYLSKVCVPAGTLSRAEIDRIKETLPVGATLEVTGK